MYLPNRDELSLRVVLALPNASMIGLVAKICSSTSLMPLDVDCVRRRGIVRQRPDRERVRQRRRGSERERTFFLPGLFGSSTVAK